MKPLVKLSFVISILLARSLVLLGQDNYNFEQITVQEGLSSNNVRIVSRDHLGYIWIATVDGLHKYDGNTMQTYLYEKNSEVGLPSNRINFIYEDDALNLWFGTSHGLAIYNRANDSFESFQFKDVGPEVISVCKHNEDIVFACINGLAIRNSNDQNFKEIVFDNNDRYQIISLDASHLLLSSSGEGVLKYNIKTNEFSPFIKSKQAVNGFALDNQAHLWIAFSNKLVCADKRGNIIDVQPITNSTLLNGTIILDVIVKDNEVWISTDGNGLFIYNQNTKHLQHLEHSFGRIGTLPANSIKDLFVDDFGNVLAGSVRGGVIWINRGFIQSFSGAVPGGNYGLLNPTALAFHEDNSGKIWIGTDGGGMNIYDPQTNTFEHVKEFNTGKVVSICGFGEDKLLVSFYNDKLKIYDIRNKQFERNPKYDFMQYIGDEVLFYPVVLKNDAQGAVWKLGGEKMKIEPDGTFELIDSINNWSGDMQQVMYALDVINDEEFVVGGYDSAYRVNTVDKTIKPIFSLLEERWQGGTNSKLIYSIENSGGEMWFATSIGLFSYNIKTEEIRGHRNNLFASVLGVAKGTDSSLWIGANNGLFRYFPHNGNYHLYGRSEGVKRSEFVNRSAFTSNTGAVYLGAVNGFVRVNPQAITKVERESKVYLDKIVINGAPADVDASEYRHNGKINLDWDNTSLRVNLIVREKEFFRKRIYRILLEGNSDEVFETTSPQLSFTHLRSGKYLLKVWCNRIDGSWPDEYTSLEIKVAFPWWKQWWFFTGMFVIIIILFVLIHYYLSKQSSLMVELEVERERKEQNKLLNEQKLEFFTNISHELRTPLSLIYGPLKSIVDSKKIDNHFEQLQLMYRQAGKMKRLVDQVLDIRKMEAGKDELVLTKMDLGPWLTDFINQFELEYDSKKIHVKSDYPTQLVLNLDIDKLDKILSNLFTNAIKYSPEGGVIHFSLFTENQQLIFVVEDEGPGVKENEIDKLFERFFQASGHKSGSGVGLAFVNDIVESLGGQIKVSNRPQKGARFECSLPMITTQEVKREEIDVKLQGTTDEVSNLGIDYSSLSGKTILVVEDDNDLRKFIVDGLKIHCQVIEASNGREAWHLVQSKMPDMLVSDVMMPLMDGFELCAKVKEDVNVSHTPVLLLTAKSDGDSRLQGYKSGADAYLSKPFSFDILCVRIINIFSNREVQKEIFKNSTVQGIKTVTHSNPDEVFLRKVVGIITDNMEDPQFDVNRLNAEFAMSRSGFYAKIKAITGEGVNDFIKAIKMNKAAELLNETSLSIGEIADHVGYENQRYFSTVFKDLKNMTPSQYRQVKK